MGGLDLVITPTIYSGLATFLCRTEVVINL